MKKVFLIFLSITLVSGCAMSIPVRNDYYSLSRDISNHDTQTLLKDLKDPNFQVRQLAAHALNNRGNQALEPLLVASSDSHFSVRAAAISSLTDIFNQTGDPRALKVIIAGLKDRNLIVALAAADCLGYIKNKEAIDTLIPALHDKRTDGYGNSISAYAAKSLVRIGGLSIEPLINSLKDNTFEVRYLAIDALGKIKDVRAVVPLVSLLNEAKEKPGRDEWAFSAKDLGVLNVVRLPNLTEQIKRALIEIGEPGIEPLIVALKDKDSQARYDIAYCLGKIKSPRAAPPLIEILKSSTDTETKKSAIWILGQLSGEDFGYDSAKWQDWWEKNKVY